MILRKYFPKHSPSAQTLSAIKGTLIFLATSVTVEKTFLNFPYPTHAKRRNFAQCGHPVAKFHWPDIIFDVQLDAIMQS
jgi:hypothetical protein